MSIKIKKSEVVNKTAEKKVEASKIIKHQKTVTPSTGEKVVKVKKEKVSKRSPAIQERRQFIADMLLKRQATYEEIAELTNKKYTNLWQIGTGYVSGVLWDLNRGNLGLKKPEKLIERMVELDGKIVPYSVKKATKKAVRISKKNPILLDKYDLNKQAEGKEEKKAIKKIPIPKKA